MCRTVAEDRELIALMRRIAVHATRVEGLVHGAEDVVTHRHFHEAGGYWTWSASVGKHTTSEAGGEEEALHALLGIISSKASRG